MRSPLSAIGIKDGRFEKASRLTWDGIEKCDLIAMRRGIRIRSQIDDALGRTGRQLDRWRRRHKHFARAYASAMQFPTLAAVPLYRPTIIRHVSLVSRGDFVVSPAAQRFVETAKQVLPAQRIVDRRGDLPFRRQSRTGPRSAQ
jgi:hypothetical protein